MIEFSWAWKIFVPVVIVVIGLKLLLAGVFGNKPDRMGRDMKKSGKAPITVPDSINVKVESNSVFGEFSNRTTDREDVPTLCVSGKCLFGKVEIDRQ